MLNFVLNIQKLLKNLNNLPKNIIFTKIKQALRGAEDVAPYGVGIITPCGYRHYVDSRNKQRTLRSVLFAHFSGGVELFPTQASS